MFFRAQVTPSITLIQDGSNDRSLKRSIIKSLEHPGTKIVVLCFQSPPEYYAQLIATNSFSFYDGFNDPLHWIDPTIENSIALERINEFISSLETTPCMVVVDDLLMFGRSVGGIDHLGNWRGFFHIIKVFSKERNLFVFANSDLVSSEQQRSLQYISNTTVSLKSRENCSYHCEVLSKKKTGKVTREITFLTITDKNELMFSKRLERGEKKSDPEVDPTSNLTFNLRLTSSEIEAKSNTVLPYLLDGQSKASCLKKTRGEIIYRPDDGDDFDEEDPDEDLDF